MQNQLTDLYRNGIKTAADVARLSIETSIRLQEKQLEIARSILEEQARSADEITRAGSLQELLALQSRFATAQLGRMAELWSSMWQGAQAFTTRSSEEVARAAANQVSRAAGSVAESAEAANHERKGLRKSA